MKLNQKQFLQEQVDRLDAEDGGPSEYTGFIRAQIARIEAGEKARQLGTVDAADQLTNYIFSVGSKGDSSADGEKE